MRQRKGPLTVNAVVALAAASGAACVLLAVFLTANEGLPAAWRTCVVVALSVGAGLPGIYVRGGGSRRVHTWGEAAFLIALVLLPAGALVLAVTFAAGLASVLRRGPIRKAAFNTSVVAVYTSLGAALATPAHLYTADLRWGRTLTATRLLLVLLATLVAPLLSTALTSAVVAAERGRSALAGAGEAYRSALLFWARNVLAGLGLLVSFRWSPGVTAFVLVALLGTHFFSADRSAIRQERFAWHRLQAAIDQLRDVELDELIHVATTAAATMMRADAAEIQLYANSGHATLLRASDIEAPHAPADDDPDHGHSMDVDLSTREGKVGELRLLFTQTVKLSDAESECLTAFANALAVALANAMKFDAIKEEARRRIRAAYTDPVTGVGNLMMLDEEATCALTSVKEGNLAAIAVIGLNRFAEVNDLLGAHAADQMLRAVATRLSNVVRRCDVVARLHGAEYVLLLRELSSEAAGEAQAELAVRSLGTAITADGLDLTVDAHTGLACAPVDGDNLDDLVRRARLAMYKARANDVPVYRYHAELEPPALAQVELLRDLRDALSENQLVLHYQPKFSLRGGTPIAAEALVRWQHPQRGMIPPAEFIPLLERCGLVGDLTRYVLDVAIAECAEWQRMGLPLSVAVNLSARNLLDEDLPRFVLECLSRHDLAPDRLICEITETAVFSRSPIAASILDQMRAAGIGLSLDDFCTGYSSLSLLRERTIDEIKIDRSFVADLGVGTRTTQIVTALIELAHRCDIVVTAEGIESAEQQHLLTTLGCDHAQGYLLAKPMPADAVRAFFLDAMKGAPVAQLPRQQGRKLRSASSLSRWDDPAGWPEASSE